MDFIINSSASPKSHTHLQFTRANATTKNCKRVCLCLRTLEMKIVANLKDKMTENKECQCLTKAIRNLGNVLILKFIALKTISGKLKVYRFKIPNYA